MSQQNYITIELPSGVPQPRFKFFQQVQFERDWGQIVGIQYVSSNSSWADKLGIGWNYTLQLAPGSPSAKNTSIAVVEELALEEWEG